jgi:predicted nucleic acid-binding protein
VTSVVVDTNVLVSFLTDCDPGQQAQAAELLAKAAGRELEVVLHQVVVTETVYVLLNLYRVSREDTAVIVRELLAMPGVTTVDELPWSVVLDWWPAQLGELGDAVLAAVTKVGRHDAVATFDTTFRRRLKRLKLTSYW